MSNNKQVFRFYTDEKMTVWFRKYFEVESENYDDAVKEAIRQSKEDDYDDYSMWEQQDDTLEGMTVEQNNNNSTQELYYNGNNIPEMIYDNTQLD